MLFSYQDNRNGTAAITLQAARIGRVGGLGSVGVIEVSCCAWFNNPMSTGCGPRIGCVTVSSEADSQ